MSEEEYLPLTHEQELIAYASPGERQLVLAPPGTGKTHVVIARIEYLITEELLEPYELAVLCFTRAAVSEIVRRVTELIKDAGMHDDIRFVAVRSFDSFATRLLINLRPDETDLGSKDYDQRIALAVQALRTMSDDDLNQISNYRHLIVDEIQDLVGVRADLVKELLRRISGGFTLLGDPAQAIYDFARKGSSPTESLISWVQIQRWSGGLQQRELTFNHRATGQIQALFIKARQYVLGSDQNTDAERALRELLLTVPQTGSANAVGIGLRSTAYDRVCILCRSNGELLQLANLLAGQGIEYNIRPKADEYALPAWLGRVMGDYVRTRMHYPLFEERWQALVGEDELVECEQAWRWLKRLESREQPDLDMRELRYRLSVGYRLPDEADAGLYSGGQSLMLSTIHSSKGREFDHVVLLEQDGSASLVRNNNDNREEARVLYVAATRARELLTRLGRKGLGSNLWKHNFNSGRYRWLSRAFGGPLFMEVGLSGDIAPESHVSTYVHENESAARESQNILWEAVRPGTRLHIAKLVHARHTFFQIRLMDGQSTIGRPFAQTSLGFLEDLRDILRQEVGSRFSYPQYWDTIRAARLVTEVLPLHTDKVHSPYSRSGFILGIRVKGMVYVTGAERRK